LPAVETIAAARKLVEAVGSSGGGEQHVRVAVVVLRQDRDVEDGARGATDYPRPGLVEFSDRGIDLPAERIPVGRIEIRCAVGRVAHEVGGIVCGVSRHHFSVRNAASTAYSRTWMRSRAAS
jgi:hypothetical protein